MKHIKLTAVLALLLAAVAARAQQPASLVGKYEGTAKASGGDVQMTLQLSFDADKFGGTVTTARATYKVTKGQWVNGVLTLDAEGNGSTGKFTLRQKDEKLVGEFLSDGKTGSVEFHRAVMDEISGDWDGVADAQGQPFPFTLSLKLEGDKVTGTSSSQLGTASISAGTWKDGKLSIVLDGGSGQIVMAATMVEGKLSGDYDFAGQTSGKWVAIRKK